MFSFISRLFQSQPPVDDISEEVRESADELKELQAASEDIQSDIDKCLHVLRVSKRRRQHLQEQYESLLLATHDPQEFPILLRIHQHAEPFILREGALGSVTCAASSSSEGEGDHRDAIVSIDANRPTLARLDLFRLTEASFHNTHEYESWLRYLEVWRARKSLTNEGTRKALFGRIDTEIESLEDRLFNLQVQLPLLKSEERTAAFEMEDIVAIEQRRREIITGVMESEDPV